MKLMGYQRENGHFGVRNHVLIIPTSVCATDTAEKIAAQVPGAIAIPNQHGCCQIGSDLALTQQTIVGFGKNANVGACVVVGLGCDGIQARAVAEEIRTTGKRVEVVVIQEEGGTLPAIAKGALYAAQMARDLSMQKRVEFDMSEIIMALECGGSDPTSGLASNPSIGYCSNRLIAEGGSSILSETTEVIGAEHLLAARFEDEDQKQKFLDMVKNVENRAIALGEDLRSGQPTPGNKEGGLSTIEEKSLGCMYKAGTAPFKGALNYAELLPLEKKGLYFMDTPGQDIDSITGMVAGGAQVVIFSTGRGTPTGSPIAPVIKITGNDATYRKMSDNIDINAGRIITEGAKVEEIGEELFQMVADVCNGQVTKAESLGHREFGIYKLTGTF
ncbi:UxaA family hydrolase [Merdimmobilis hominis]|jgi:altronate dehydratase large subunit|uniref:(2R)-sulfolactate sulfo-lyase subunit beta n=1 Tax=uncultured Anaerotruncus sp. TaxID=905011 RepID=A0A6N2UP42_9FIRM|nr:UxaA family hydrolase [Merdimmobilis hominis]MCD4835304.1 UxaA family hydrolase [Merdimmobilis hominis]PWL61212.1 MAG: carbohydrate hydrolase [Oscillospiraceae bacterium]PWL62839.1 MAG: carbohydrate hydrolase [Oscillospiraceae bacterium]